MNNFWSSHFRNKLEAYFTAATKNINKLSLSSLTFSFRGARSIVEEQGAGGKNRIGHHTGDNCAPHKNNTQRGR